MYLFSTPCETFDANSRELARTEPRAGLPINRGAFSGIPGRATPSIILSRFIPNRAIVFATRQLLHRRLCTKPEVIVHRRARYMLIGQITNSKIPIYSKSIRSKFTVAWYAPVGYGIHCCCPKGDYNIMLLWTIDHCCTVLKSYIRSLLFWPPNCLCCMEIEPQTFDVPLFGPALLHPFVNVRCIKLFFLLALSLSKWHVALWKLGHK